MHPRLTWGLAFGTRLVLVAVLALLTTGFVLRVFDFSQAPDYGEGTLLATIERMGRQPVSADWLTGPEITLSPYGPVYYMAVRAARAVLPWKHSLIPGRLVSLLATLIATALVGLVVGRRTGHVELAMLAAVVLLVSPVVFTWATPHRVDPLAVLLALAAYIALDLRRHGLVLSACLIVLASLVKQSMALSGLAVFVYLLCNRQYKPAFGYAILVAGLGVFAWSALDRASGGYYLAAAVRGHLGPMWPQQGFEHFYWFLATPLGLAASITIAWVLLKEPAEATRSVYALGFVLSTLIASLLSCKEGASYAYFFEASVLGAVVVGQYGLAALLSLHRERALLAASLAALILAAPEARFLRHRGFRFDTTPYGSAILSARLARSVPGYVLADGQYIEAVLQAGWRPLVNDPFLLRQMVRNGTLQPAPVLEAMQRGEVKYLVLKRTVARHRAQIGTTSQKWPPEVLHAMERWYVLDQVAGDDLFLYRHRGDRVTP